MPITHIPCPGCNRAWRQAEAAGLPHDVQPNLGQPVHCYPCQARTRAALGELPELLAAIWLEATHGTARPADVTTSRPANIAPWPGQASRLLTDLIVGGLAELEDDIRDLRHLTTRPTAIREGTAVTQTITFLGTHLAWTLEHHPAATEIHERGSANPAAQITTWHRSALRFTSRDEPRQIRRLAPCPRCQGPYLVNSADLITANGDPYIECRDPDCARLLTPAEYQTYVEALTRQETAA